jgi:N-methylhydantoinase A/oxoprolinase/acetone carboxylase beta subunit
VPPAPDLRIGIDVGGTNTDAVCVDRADALLAKAKVATTPDVTEGIRRALDGVLHSPEVALERVTHVMLGTTHATNAVLERSRLQKVAVVRIGGPATHSIRPLLTWPDDLRVAISAGETIVDGGIEYDGRELSSFDRDAVARFLEPLAGSVEGVAFASVFSPVSPRHELEAREVAQQVLGEDVSVSLSHEIGSIGLLERENATVLNEALRTVARGVAVALKEALEAHGISPTVYFTQNDGTLMVLDYALRYPVLTIGSGPANSLRGAAFLSGRSDALVADIGGTSTDVGVLQNGFPRESSAPVEIGGIRTNFRMPDLVSIPLGGGTVVDGANGSVQVGPRSVGYRLEQEALIFGGSTPTMTDAAVAAGRAAIGSRSPDVGPLLQRAIERSDEMLADAVDRVKLSRGDRPLIVVGGGSVIVPERLEGVSEIHRPEHHDVANALGAVIAAVSGQVDEVVSYGNDRRGALDAVSQRARERAVLAGADPARVEVVELEEIPLAYLNDPAVRVRVKAAGPLAGL